MALQWTEKVFIFDKNLPYDIVINPEKENYEPILPNFATDTAKDTYINTFLMNNGRDYKQIVENSNNLFEANLFKYASELEFKINSEDYTERKGLDLLNANFCCTYNTDTKEYRFYWITSDKERIAQNYNKKASIYTFKAVFSPYWTNKYTDIFSDKIPVNITRMHVNRWQKPTGINITVPKLNVNSQDYMDESDINTANISLIPKQPIVKTANPNFGLLLVAIDINLPDSKGDWASDASTFIVSLNGLMWYLIGLIDFTLLQNNEQTTTTTIITGVNSNGVVDIGPVTYTNNIKYFQGGINYTGQNSNDILSKYIVPGTKRILPLSILDSNNYKYTITGQVNNYILNLVIPKTIVEHNLITFQKGTSNANGVLVPIPILIAAVVPVKNILPKPKLNPDKWDISDEVKLYFKPYKYLACYFTDLAIKLNLLDMFTDTDFGIIPVTICLYFSRSILNECFLLAKADNDNIPTLFLDEQANSQKITLPTLNDIDNMSVDAVASTYTNLRAQQQNADITAAQRQTNYNIDTFGSYNKVKTALSGLGSGETESSWIKNKINIADDYEKTTNIINAQMSSIQNAPAKITGATDAVMNLYKFTDYDIKVLPYELPFSKKQAIGYKFRDKGYTVARTEPLTSNILETRTNFNYIEASNVLYAIKATYSIEIKLRIVADFAAGITVWHINDDNANKVIINDTTVGNIERVI